MKKYVEVQTAKEFALGFFPDPILRMAVNQLLDNAPAAEVTEPFRYETASPATAGMVSWLRDKADRAHDVNWGRMMKRIAGRLEALDRSQRWIPAGKPPEDGMVVLVTDGRYVDTATYDAEEDFYDVDHAFVDPDGVVGWKHLSDLLEVI